MAVTAELFDTDGTTSLGVLDEAWGHEWQDPLNTPGTGSVMIHVDDALASAAVAGTFVSFSEYGQRVFTFRVDAPERVYITEDEEAGEVIKLAGLGWECALDDARVFHEFAGQVPPADWRPFNFAVYSFVSFGDSAVSYGTVPTNPYWSVAGVAAPVDFPDDTAEWIWVPELDPEAPVISPCYFRTAFGLGADTEVYLAGSGAIKWTMYLDGIAVLGETTDPYTWQSYKGVKLRLSAGDHYVALVGEPNDSAHAAAGVVATVMGLDADGDPDTGNVLVHTDDTWDCLDHPGFPPGLTVGAMLQQLIGEAAARSVIVPDVSTWDGVNDANGDPWDTTPDYAVPVGDSLLTVLTRMAEEGLLDYRMDPDSFTLRCYRPGAVGDPGGTVTFSEGVNLREISHEPPPALVTRLLVKYGRGFFTLEDPFFIGTVVREQFLTVPSDDLTEATAYAQRVLNQIADDTMPVVATVEPRGADRPYADFVVGDTVTVPDAAGSPEGRRLLSITCKADDEGDPEWTLELNRRRTEPTERVVKLLQSLGSVVSGDAPGSKPVSTKGYGYTPSYPFYDVKYQTGRPATNPDGVGGPTSGGGGGGGDASEVQTCVGQVATNSSNTTPSDVPGMTFSVLSGNQYSFRFMCTFRTQATGTGIGFVFTAPTLAVSNYMVTIRQAAAGTDAFYQNSATNLTTVLVSTAALAANTDYIAVIEGFFSPSADGDLQLQVRSEVNGSQVTVQSGGVGILFDHDTAYQAGSITFTPSDFVGTGSWTVPAGVSSITITADGQSGSDTSSGTGGNGGRVEATWACSPGDTVDIVWNGTGGESGAGSGGGGGGSGGAAGGAGTIVKVGGITVVIAGGGGGAGGGPGTSGGDGGDGGQTTTNGQTGNAGTGAAGVGGNGATGSAGTGGAGGGGGSNGSNGSTDDGGGGGAPATAGGGGGGGGGGYRGGGGGGGGDGDGTLNNGGGGGGGGGTSFAHASATGVVYSDGAVTGNRSVTITW